MRKEIPFKKPSKTFTIKEYEEAIKNGEKYVVLDDMVLDVKEYQDFHPGGNFLIKYNIGRDVSKFFYGGYALDNTQNSKGVYTHSSKARQVVNTLVIAYLEKPTQSMSAKVGKSYAINKTAKTYEFDLEQNSPTKKGDDTLSEIKNEFVDDSLAENIGKHYLV